MALSKEQSKKIKKYLVTKILQKLNNYKPETNYMPFHYRLLGKDRMALFSFIHSINTTLGVSIFEQIGALIATPHAKIVIPQYKNFEGYLSSEAVLTIDNITRELRTSTRKPNKLKETTEVLSVANKGSLGKKIKKRIDLFMLTKDDKEYYFELKTAKPNIDVFKSTKKQLLEWIAMRFTQKP